MFSSESLPWKFLKTLPQNACRSHICMTLPSCAVTFILSCGRVCTYIRGTYLLTYIDVVRCSSLLYPISRENFRLRARHVPSSVSALSPVVVAFFLLERFGGMLALLYGQHEEGEQQLSSVVFNTAILRRKQDIWSRRRRECSARGDEARERQPGTASRCARGQQVPQG